MATAIKDMYEQPAGPIIKIHHNPNTFETQVLIDGEVKASIVDGLPKEAYRVFWSEVFSRMFPILGVTDGDGTEKII